ncbi:uncharacterized protein RAG0_08503 [Rhynchosporium agropyri]|uniref:Uncharacterized protein n=1 Tax=Rhynchosporium agropyri TaxID=914238 RepID=A0A1E1KR19_9HELO|nr:uncharacterized protein RAG0_08503 [Rhynchosporium agropyri]
MSFVRFARLVISRGHSQSIVLKELRPPMIPIRDLKRESRTITESSVMVEEYWRVRGRGRKQDVPTVLTSGLKFPNLTHPLRAPLRI